MLTLKSATLMRGAKTLLSKVDLTIDRGQKVGIIGPNGAGKSSLFALIEGQIELAAGSFDRPARLRLSVQRQHIDDLSRSALDFVLDGDALWREIDTAMRAPQVEATAIGALAERFEQIDGYRAPARAAALLAGLGFAAERINDPVGSYSGGWRVRLALARTLHAPGDLYLLDEPTNHLDLDTILWLAEHLRRLDATVLAISHDRDFLDSFVNRVVGFERDGLYSNTGTVSDYLEARALRLEQQAAAHARQSAELDRLTRFIDRFRAKASKARQVQSRVKALARVERIAPVLADADVEFVLTAKGRPPNPMITLDNVTLGYDGKALLNGVNLQLVPGARIALLGRNGAGKSTLIRALVGELPPLAGTRTAGGALRIGYFAQHQLELLDPTQNAIEHLRAIDPQIGEQRARDWLGRFRFVGDMALRPVGPFSGGEQARLVLALIAYGEPQLLILDEPTNHLDMLSREALALALNDYEGALVLVAHDRRLLAATINDYWLIRGPKVEPFAGDLDDYAQWLREQNRERASERSAGGGADNRSAQRAKRAAEREQIRPLRDRVRELEGQLTRLSSERERLQQKLADPVLFDSGNGAKVSALSQDLAQVSSRLALVEELYLEALSALEAVQA